MRERGFSPTRHHNGGGGGRGKGCRAGTAPRVGSGNDAAPGPGNAIPPSRAGGPWPRQPSSPLAHGGSGHEGSRRVDSGDLAPARARGGGGEGLPQSAVPGSSQGTQAATAAVGRAAVLPPSAVEAVHRRQPARVVHLLQGVRGVSHVRAQATDSSDQHSADGAWFEQPRDQIAGQQRQLGAAQQGHPGDAGPEPSGWGRGRPRRGT